MKIPLSKHAAIHAHLELTADNLYELPENKREKPKNFQDDVFTLNPQVRGDVLELSLDDPIDQYWGIGPGHLQQALAGHDDKPVLMRINSPGGSVFDSLAMREILVSRKQPWTARITLAASAAGTLSLGANRLEIVEGGQYMLHNAWTYAAGNAGDLRAQAKLLDAIDYDIADAYAKRMGKTRAHVLDLMEAETWLSANEAIEAGIADELIATVAKKEDKPEARANNNLRAAVAWGVYSNLKSAAA